MTPDLAGGIILVTLGTVAIIADWAHRRWERRTAQRDAQRPCGYTLTQQGQVVTDAIITAILQGRDPIAVKVMRHPSGIFADVVCAGDAVEGAEAILRDGAA